MKRLVVQIFLLFIVVATLSSCEYNVNITLTTSDDPGGVSQEQYLSVQDMSIKDYFSYNPYLDEAVDEVFTSLDNHQKISQLLMPAVGELGMDSVYAAQLIENHIIGNVMLLGGSQESFLDISTSLQSVAQTSDQPLLLVGADGEFSLINKKIRNTPKVLPASDMHSLDVVEENAGLVADILQDVGVNYNFAPVVDMAGESPIGYRGFGESENIVPYSKSFVDTMTNAGILSSIKHFPGHGLVEGDSHNMLPVIDGDLQELGNFARLMDEGALSVMIGHLAVKNNDTYDTNGLPASVSDVIVGELLRGELGYEGIVITDAMNMAGVASIPDAHILSISAGVDILLMPNDIEKVHDDLYEKYISDENFQQKVDIAVKRILRVKILLQNTN